MHDIDGICSDYIRIILQKQPRESDELNAALPICIHMQSTVNLLIEFGATAYNKEAYARGDIVLI